ncbi:NAD(P)/FAD-dependent oxidoreductase [soil metagenome]
MAAALLARAGRSVIVVERRSCIGGAVATEEIVAGYRAPMIFSGMELFHPDLMRVLSLEDHGLQVLAGRGGTCMAKPDGTWLDLGHSEARSLSRLSAKDREALLEFERFTGALARVLAPLQCAPLPSLGARDMASRLHLAGAVTRLRRLGASDMNAALRYLPMPIQDVLDERFESDALKAAIAAPALTAAWLGPRSAGSAYGLLHHRPAWCGGLFAPKRFAAGGPGALSAALAASASAHGAEIRTDTPVHAVRMLEDDEPAATNDTADSGRARAAGVILEDGTEILSHVVVSGIDPRSTLLKLVGARWLDPQTVRSLQNLRMRGSVAIVRFALSRRPRFHGAPDNDAHLAGRILIGASLDYLERAFDRAKYGLPPEQPWLEITLPSIVDKSLAPPGRQVMHVWVQYAARTLRDSDWTTERESLLATVTGLIEAHASDFAASVLQADVMTPADIEERLGLTGGCLYHVEMALDQLLYMRPLPGWYRYRTPIANLYLCGPGTHPGGGISGLPGKNAAAQVLADRRWR